MSDERRDNSAIFNEIRSSETRILDYIDKRLHGVEERMGDSRTERRQFEQKVWDTFDDHMGRKDTSHHSKLEEKVEKNGRRLDSAITVYRTISLVFTFLYAVLLFFGRWIRNALFGPG